MSGWVSPQMIQPDNEILFTTEKENGLLSWKNMSETWKRYYEVKETSLEKQHMISTILPCLTLQKSRLMDTVKRLVITSNWGGRQRKEE